MNVIPIATARDLGKRHGARRLVIIAIDDDDYGITTWGSTREECRQLARWAESAKATRVVDDIARAKVESGFVLTALLPGAEGPG